MSTFANRLRKNARHRHRWAKRQGLTAYRLYDRDIPEYPFAVEWYAGRVHLVEFPRRSALKSGAAETLRAEVLDAVVSELEVPREAVYTKTHLPHAWGKSQYGRAGAGGEPFTVEEQGLRFWVNLVDYLDTGLFLDHRRTRAWVRDEAEGRRFLNLFAYTGSFSVYAAAGGAESTTTVDLSVPYTDWARRNLALNGFGGRGSEGDRRHQVVCADVLQWLDDAAAERKQFDLIVLDPPSFSSSKRMERSFNVQKDHPRLLRQVSALLSPEGALFFSNNFQGFELDREKLENLDVEELTERSIPEDFNGRPHRLWRLRHPGAPPSARGSDRSGTTGAGPRRG